MAFTLTFDGFAKPRLPKIPKRPEWALGCHNEVLKKGYIYYMSPRAMAGMISVMWVQSDGRPWYENVTTREVQEALGEIMVGVDVDGVTTPTLMTVI